jgi:hypothetical protein
MQVLSVPFGQDLAMGWKAQKMKGRGGCQGGEQEKRTTRGGVLLSTVVTNDKYYIVIISRNDPDIIIN